MRVFGIAALGAALAAMVTLAGCQSALERQEIADDQSCRKIIAERNDANPTAYKDCRANMQQYRMQRTIHQWELITRRSQRA